jgi:transcriptional regulator with XRE-family HTH domain
MARYLNKYKGLNKAVGRLIKMIRKRKGISQIELAGEIDISYQQLQKYEYGVSQISLARLKQVAEALGVPLRTFINDEAGDAAVRIPLTPKEERFLELFRTLGDEKRRDIVLDMMEEYRTIIEEGEKEEVELGEYTNS